MWRPKWNDRMLVFLNEGEIQGKLENPERLAKKNLRNNEKLENLENQRKVEKPRESGNSKLEKTK